jgi:hypothetical protein
MTYARIMFASEDGSEVIAVSVNPFAWGKTARRGPCALARNLLHHNDSEHARNETLKKMKNIGDW